MWLYMLVAFMVGGFVGAICMRLLWERANAALASLLSLMLMRYKESQIDWAWHDDIRGVIAILEGEPAQLKGRHHGS